MNIIPNALPESLRLAALAAFPNPDWQYWHRYENGKLATVDEFRIPQACRVALQQLAITIHPQRGFFDFDLHGAGCHLMPVGTSLGEHVDATYHPIRPWKRIASLVYFLNTCDGGSLVVNSRAIEAKANTAAIFEANQPHWVTETKTDRKTLSLFVWQESTEPKGRTSALFKEAAV